MTKDLPVIQNNNEPISDDSPQHYDMIVFCHLRWGFVYQRPQHIISRLAKSQKILFIEEPQSPGDQNSPYGKRLEISETLHILQPFTTDITSIAHLIPQFVKGKDCKVGWFYSAAFSPLLEVFEFETVVYDCMDELSLFKDAPPILIQQEKFLLANADIVFTGGRSLYDSKKEMHYNVFCFPSSVDSEHFAKTTEVKDIPSDLVNITKPIVGYFGVIDERIDYALLSETAKRRPDVSFVMIGPLAKVDAKDLPKRENIHYLGMKAYDELPQYVSQFDVAMMPFALNEATKYISPTKTLEYMAAGKPIISTRIKDVEREYSTSVALITTAEEFSDAIVTIANELNPKVLKAQYAKILKNTSWDSTVARMSQITKNFAL